MTQNYPQQSSMNRDSDVASRDHDGVETPRLRSQITSRKGSIPALDLPALGIPAVDLPTLDITKMVTSMFELGANVLRLQQQMFEGLLGISNADDRDDDDGRQPKARNTNSRDFDNWVRPVDRVAVARRAEEISRSPQAGSDFDNWIRAEREEAIAARAENISQSRPMGGDIENWLQAEWEIRAERDLVAARARDIAASPGARGGLDSWMQAERELYAVGRIADA